jgi:hypothetical protein
MTMKTLRKTIAIAMATLMFLNIAPIGLAQAAMVTTDQVIERADQAADRERVEGLFMREDVRQQLEQLGIDPDEASSRVASLSDEEIQEIAGRLDELPAGEGGVGVVVGAILIVFLVLLITDLLGVTDVFPFVKKKAD